MVTPHIQQSIAWSLRCRQCHSNKVGAQVSFAYWAWRSLMHKLQTLPLDSGGDGKWAGGEHRATGRSSLNCPMQHDISWWNWVHNCHLRSRKLLPTHCDLLSLVCHLLVWPFQYTVYTWSGFRGPGIPLHFLWTQLEHTPQKTEFVQMPLRHMAQGSLPDFWSTVKF